MWAGVVVVALSAAGFAVTAASTGQRAPVLMVAKGVSAGQVLKASDLRTVKVAADDGVVLARQKSAVIGKRAAVPLVAGSLLAPGEVGAKGAYPPKGYSEMSYALEPGGAPPRLAFGERVAVVDGADGSAAASATTKAQDDKDVPVVVGTVAVSLDMVGYLGFRVRRQMSEVPGRGAASRCWSLGARRSVCASRGAGLAPSPQVLLG